MEQYARHGTVDSIQMIGAGTVKGIASVGVAQGCNGAGKLLSSHHKSASLRLWGVPNLHHIIA